MGKKLITYTEIAAGLQNYPRANSPGLPYTTTQNKNSAEEILESAHERGRSDVAVYPSTVKGYVAVAFIKGDEIFHARIKAEDNKNKPNYTFLKNFIEATRLEIQRDNIIKNLQTKEGIDPSRIDVVAAPVKREDFSLIEFRVYVDQKLKETRHFNLNLAQSRAELFVPSPASKQPTPPPYNDYIDATQVRQIKQAPRLQAAPTNATYGDLKLKTASANNAQYRLNTKQTNIYNSNGLSTTNTQTYTSVYAGVHGYASASAKAIPVYTSTQAQKDKKEVKNKVKEPKELTAIKAIAGLETVSENLLITASKNKKTINDILETHPKLDVVIYPSKKKGVLNVAVRGNKGEHEEINFSNLRPEEIIAKIKEHISVYFPATPKVTVAPTYLPTSQVPTYGTANLQTQPKPAAPIANQKPIIQYGSLARNSQMPTNNNNTPTATQPSTSATYGLFSLNAIRAEEPAILAKAAKLLEDHYREKDKNCSVTYKVAGTTPGTRQFHFTIQASDGIRAIYMTLDRDALNKLVANFSPNQLEKMPGTNNAANNATKPK